MTVQGNEQHERETVKRKLDEELNAVNFRAHDNVLRRTHPASLRARLSALWNREVEIPLRPAGIAFGAAALGLALILPYAARPPRDVQTTAPQRQMIEAGGSFYWKDLYEKAVSEHDR
ncbi:hypothetical protein QWJ34_19585 [Saccharibacillus sp. CPCC 101409]|uniref:hypothetical protein n=1 Tax=Saccharibacillus sp. CPCC 101409 TaxID=3058041 RepID=UPI002672C760|nr:hypothetical protein [Saccharibacillus sp. CPCC 101409]MDO3411974.1 hypothetical protein [Saccharibacillus sp. CPCC 101409]